MADISTVGDAVRRHAELNPDSLAMVFKNRQTSYQSLNRLSNRVANGLSSENLSSRSRIAYLGKNTDTYYEIFFGAAKAGVVMVAVNWRLALPEVEYILNDSGVEIIYIESEFETVAEHCQKNCKKLEKVIYIDKKCNDGYAFWRDKYADDDPRINIQPESTCIQMYTSGTTGNPKGVLLSHRCFLKQRESERLAGDWAHWQSSDINLAAMPAFHIAGTGWAFLAFFHGATNIIHPAPDAELIAEDIAKYGISKMFVVPAVLQLIIKIAKQKNIKLSSMVNIIYGASPIPESLLRESLKLFGCGFVQQYGMTEATGAVSYLPPEDHDVHGNKRMSSCGKALPGVEFKICNKAGEPLPANNIGEIFIKTPTIMSGYWNMDAATEEALINGWYRSGDAGYLDSDGYLFMQDRVKDMIVSGGENVYPAEIEKVLHLFPNIEDAAVIGVPDEQWGESVKALVTPIQGKEIIADDVIRFVRDHIAGYKVPKSIDVIESMPRNASGKILKTVLREPFWKGHKRRIN